MMTKAGLGRVETLEALRGVAALLVVLYHLQYIFEVKAGIVPFGGLFGSGDRGVDLFFVLSGFIIMTTHMRDIGSSVRLLPYLYKRSCRIFPSVWIMTLVAAALYADHFGGADKAAKLEPWSVVASALLLPQNGPALVNVTWTLKYEVFFYAVFALLIVSRRFGLSVLLAWQGVIVLTAAGMLHWVNPVAAFYVRPLCLEFGIGMFCAWLVLRQDLRMRAVFSSGCLLAVGLIGFAGGLLYEALRVSHGLEAARVVVFGGSSGTMILGLTRLERDGHIRAPALLAALGSVSYAVYLVHYSVITLAATLLVRIGWIPLNDAVLLGCAALGVAAGAGFHHLVDQPIQVRLRGLGRRLFETGSASSVGSASLNGLTMPQITKAEW